MISGSNIFMTGGAGFIGSHIVKRLVGRNNVVVYDTLGRNALRNICSEHKNLSVIKGNTLDYSSLLSAMKGSDIVIHLASVSGVDTVIRDPILTMMVNTVGSFNVIESSFVSRVKRLIVFSTGEVYNTTFKPHEEDTMKVNPPGNPRWTYSASKIAAEHMAFSYHNKHNLPIVIIRPFNIYGPAQVGTGTINNFIKKAICNDTLEVHGDGSQIRSWCYVSDIVDFVEMCCYSDDVISNVFNVGNHNGALSVYELAKKIISASRSDSRIKFVDKPYDGYIDIGLRIPSVDKAMAFGFEAKTDLDDGIAKTLDWYNENSSSWME